MSPIPVKLYLGNFQDRELSREFHKRATACTSMRARADNKSLCFCYYFLGTEKNDYLIQNCLNTDFQNHLLLISSPVVVVLSHPSLTINASIVFDISWLFWPDPSSSLQPKCSLLSLHMILPPPWYLRASQFCTSPSSTPRPSPVSITHILDSKPHDLTYFKMIRPLFTPSLQTGIFSTHLVLIWKSRECLKAIKSSLANVQAPVVEWTCAQWWSSHPSPCEV